MAFGSQSKQRPYKLWWHLCFIFLMSMVLIRGLPAYAQSAPSHCGSTPIRFADQSWESAAFTTYLLKNILEKGYGCQVEVVPGSSAALELALTQNDIQVLPELWDGRTEVIDKAVEKGQVLVIGDTLKGGAEQGWYVPSYVLNGDSQRQIAAMAPQLRSASQLHQYKHLFQSSDNAELGRFYGCPAGWVCEKTNTALLRAHGLDSSYENFKTGTGAALDAAISAAYERGEPILFYYWQPAGLMAKYDLTRLEQPPFNAACWEKIVKNSPDACLSDFKVSHLRVAVSQAFAQAHPDIIHLFEKYSLSPEMVNAAILTMSESYLTGQEMADRFMEEYPDLWLQWLPEFIAQPFLLQQVQTTVPLTDTPTAFFPSWSIAPEINQSVAAMVRSSGDVFRVASQGLLLYVLAPLERLLGHMPPWLVLLLIGGVAWHATRKIVVAGLCVAGFYLIGALGLWDKLMQTLALVVVSTVVSIVIGIPTGIWVARNYFARRFIMPLLDMMQTMPSFVYLVPVLMLFGLGKVPALVATVVYAVPPLIRLTSLGIRQVDHELIEAVQSFGVTPWQRLILLSLPLARPSIMAGINQTTMMALSMVVVASMIGAQGLGEDVLAGIQTLDIGRGLQAGVAIVIVAIVIDRITQAYGQSKRRKARNQGTPWLTK